MRIGHGYDVHKFAENRKLIIGGEEIPFELGLLGHSDADVLLHAIMDALLGAAALGDIGKLFPDTDDRFEGADSVVLLKEVCRVLSENNYKIVNIDSTVIAQKPTSRLNGIECRISQQLTDLSLQSFDRKSSAFMKLSLRLDDHCQILQHTNGH